METKQQNSKLQAQIKNIYNTKQFEKKNKM